eukprot:365887-Chlamydomonas_euryale.AAC.5
MSDCQVNFEKINVYLYTLSYIPIASANNYCSRPLVIAVRDTSIIGTGPPRWSFEYPDGTCALRRVVWGRVNLKGRAHPNEQDVRIETSPRRIAHSVSTD